MATHPTSGFGIRRLASGQTKILGDWGITGAVRTLVNQGRDTLVLSFDGANLLGNLPFEAGDELLLIRFDGDGENTVFRGHIHQPARRSAHGAREGCRIVADGPWWWLENIVYCQPANFAVDVSLPFIVPPAAYELTSKATSQLLVGEDETRTRVDSRFMVIAALQYAISKGAPLQYGILDPGLDIPREAISDLTCAEVILRCLRWTPSQVAWFDYTTAPPTLYIRDRENLAELEIDVDAHEIDQIELNPRDDLIIQGVTINYMRRHQRYVKRPADPAMPDGPYALEPLEVATLEVEQAGPVPDGVGALVLTTELFGSTVYQTAVEPPTFDIIAEEPSPVGIAAALYAAWSRRQFEGRISRVAQECAAAPWISRAIKMLNGNVAWRDQLMDVRQAVDDLFSGRTELHIGPSLQLGPSDLLSLLRKGKTIPPLRGDVIIRTTPTPVPVIPPTPPNVIPPIVPPRDPPPDTDPHTDYDPADFIVTNTRYSGTRTENVEGFAPPYPAETDYPPLGGEPIYTVITIAASGIGADLLKSAVRSYSPGPPPHDFTTNIGKNAEGFYTRTEFDLHLFSTGGPPESDSEFTHIASIWLVGTETKTKADGTTESKEVTAEISGGIGGRVTYLAVAPLGALHHVSGFWSPQNFSSASGSVAFTTMRVFKRPVTP